MFESHYCFAKESHNNQFSFVTVNGIFAPIMRRLLVEKWKTLQITNAQTMFETNWNYVSFWQSLDRSQPRNLPPPSCDRISPPWKADQHFAEQVFPVSSVHRVLRVQRIHCVHRCPTPFGFWFHFPHSQLLGCSFLCSGFSLVQTDCQGPRNVKIPHK